MPLAVSALILAATLVTACISGIFGMAGGLILMGLLTALVPVATAMIIHGAIQIVSNGWRAFLLRDHIDWKICLRYAVGAGAAALMLMAISWRPDRQAVFLLLGLVPLAVWLPSRLAPLDATRFGQAEATGFIVQSLNTLAGVAGPILDLFFVKTPMTRQAIVSTKAATQVLAHAVKIGFWGAALQDAATAGTMPSLWVMAAAIPLSMFGTWLGSLVLERMTDVNFKRWLKWLLTVIAFVYLSRAAGLW